MEVLDKATIQQWLLPHLSIGERGSACRVDLTEVVEAILHRLKSGCQWRQLPVKQFFTSNPLTWQGVYYHFNKWVDDGSWVKVWVNLLASNRSTLDLSSLQLDGSHTPAKNGGQAVGYQGRKAAKTTNTLFLADNTGLMLACATPQAGQHHDLFGIQPLFEELCTLLEGAGLDLKGLFLNADAGFDAEALRTACLARQIHPNLAGNPPKGPTLSEEYVYFDEELYRRRSVIERANAWLDSFKTLLVRFETKARSWTAWHLVAFTVQFCRKINRKKKR